MRIDLLGTSFTIQTDESGEYMDRVLSHLSERIETVKRSSRVSDPLKICILAGIYVIDELLREREGKSSGNLRTVSASADEADEMERITGSLIERIDAELRSTELPHQGSQAP